MKKLADIQHALQCAILGKRSAATALIAPPPEGTPAQRLGVYQSAYVLRLTEFLMNDYGMLLAYLGDVRFRRMAEDYVRTHPSDQPNARWFSRHLPEFLRQDVAFRRNPEIAEMAMLERELNDAFDGPEAPVVTMAELGAIAPAAFAHAAFGLAPTVSQLAVTTNVTSLWSSLKCGEQPPGPEDLASPTTVLVWRQGTGSRFRILGEEETMALACVAEGLSFGHVCEMIAAHDNPDEAAVRAACYLRGWIEAEIISCIRLIDEGAK